MSSDTSSVSEHQGRITEAQLRSRNFQPRVSTPDTDITECPQQPDITLFCDKCGSFILLRLLQEHRKYHSALAVLEYRDAQSQPESAAALLKRRQAVLAKQSRRAAREDRPVSMSAMQQINGAYELLKSYLEDTYEDLIQTREMIYPECRGLALTCSARCARALGICSHDNQRWKRSMEDTRVFQDYFGNDENKCFFAIYDGHNGRFAADIAANDLHHFLLREMTKFDPATACTCTLNLAEHNDLIGYQLDRPRPVIRKDSVRHILHQESHNIIQQIMHTCKENVSKLEVKNGDQPSRKEPKSKLPNRRENDPFAEKVELAFRNSYQFLDYILSYGIDEQSRVRWSGCSALTCVIQRTGDLDEEDEQDENEMGNGRDKHVETDDEAQVKELGVLYVANAGNSHAVLCQNGKAVRLTRKHTPQSSHERARVLRAGCAVKDGANGGRVNGVLDTTRGLGNHGDPLLKTAVLAEPHTVSVTIDSQSEFLILASHGVWEVLSEQEAVSLVKQLMPGQEVFPRQPLPTDDPLRDLYGIEGLNLAPSLGGDNQGADQDKDSRDSALEKDHPEPSNDINSEDASYAPPAQTSEPGKEMRQVDETNSVRDAPISQTIPCVVQPKSASASPAADSTSNGNHSPKLQERYLLSPRQTREAPSAGKVTNDDDNISDQTDFESMISALMENDDGNEADVETLTELHTIYAQSRLQEAEEQGSRTEHEMYRNLAQQMSERLVQSALLAGSRDNITVMVILLPGCKY
ncbi:protein phosphatase 2C-like domain-containing protein 1 [Acanthaster planci]|uniref:Protein phosphatase 2C-like domain-containing protein 1 n=1 Tax=Acanthaster planci TaxID=133434 RepID=A0A8B7Z4X3_ACAPL|nr:protein phosphatase 2C-like domain-containing protein 1 [Acanthaster planci]XP_022098392.1 protein phosphatase 2C-like domain-containing protein 1 [Acanthaster planci]